VANASKSSFGSILGVAIGVVLVGGLAATPFYLAKLAPPEKAVSDAAKDDVETIRRVVLNLDQDLGALADMDAALADGEKLTPEAAEKIKSAQPDLFGDELGRRLAQTAQLLKDAQQADEARKTVIPGSSPVQAGPLGAGAVVGQPRRDYLSVNANLRKQAEAAVTRLRDLKVGPMTAGSVMSVNRIEAFYYYLTGRMLSNSAEFQQEQTSAWRRAAIERLRFVASLQRDIAALRAQTPTTAIANVRDLIKQVEDQVALAEGQISELRPVVESLEAQLAELDDKAAEAQRQMAELSVGEGQLRRVEDAPQYAKLAKKQREALAKAAALLNGTLVDAKVVQAPMDDTFAVKYEGGTPRPGLRDLKFRLQQLEDDLASWQASKVGLEKQAENLAAQKKHVEAQQREAETSVETYTSEVREDLRKADGHAEAARKARSEALQAFKKAEGCAQNAARDANKRIKTAAEKARGSGGTPNECFELISKDGDTEASVLCLTAEIAFSTAATNVGEIEELKDKFATESLVAKLGGGESPADVSEKVEALKAEAAKKLADAAKAYEAAAKLLIAVNVKSSTGSPISGQNYVWQVQVGEAAVHLMRASLAALVDGTPDREAQDQAYELLTKVVQGREQSPLISTAVDTLQYLQQTAE
jgi:hypothetical protein